VIHAIVHETHVPRETSGQSARRIKIEVADKHGLRVADLEGPCRVRRFAHPRQEAMARVRRETAKGRASLAWVGRQFGGRDHTTVLHALAAHDIRVAEEAGLA
jgi:chromosomal replication initiator protein